MKRRKFGGQIFWKRLRSRVARLRHSAAGNAQSSCLERPGRGIAGEPRGRCKSWSGESCDKSSSIAKQICKEKHLSRDLATQYLCRSSLVRAHRSPTAMSQHVCRNIGVKRNQHVGGKTCTDCPLISPSVFPSAQPSGVVLLAVLGFAFVEFRPNLCSLSMVLIVKFG